MAPPLLRPLLCLALLVACKAAEKAEPLPGERRATAFVAGQALHTSRALPWTRNAQLRRALRAASMSDAAGRVLWLLGLPPSQQHQVHATLKGLPGDGTVLHLLPGDNHHWIIAATPRAVSRLLSAHQDVTVAVLEDRWKLCPRLRMALDAGFPDTRAGQPITLAALVPSPLADDLVSTVNALTVKLRDLTVPAGCSVTWAASPSQLRLSVCKEVASDAVATLAALPCVTWVEEAMPVQLHNLNSGAVMQSAASLHGAEHPPPELADGVQSGWFPFWRAGLDGSGQVVGVSDSGIDTDSCFFWDPAFPDLMRSNSTQRTPTNAFLARNAALVNVTNQDSGRTYVPIIKTTQPLNVSIFSNPAHRKIVMYAAWSDAIDANGHGTHTSGTVAGAAYGFNATEQPTLATGIAPGAKIAFFDLGSTSGRSLDVISSLMDPGVVWGTMHAAGARVTSNSWAGGAFGGYEAGTCAMLDAYSWVEQDTLHVFSAGNSGATDHHRMYTTGTVQAPATCKNVLAVGATENWVDQGRPIDQPFNLLGPDGSILPRDTSSYGIPPVSRFNTTRIHIESVGYTNVREVLMYPGIPYGNGTYQLMVGSDIYRNDTSFDSYVTPLLDKTRIRVVLANPRDACAPLKGNETRSNDTTEAIVILVYYLANSSDCTFADAVLNVMESGADGVLMYVEPDGDSDTDGPPVIGSTRFQGKRFPALTITVELGVLIQSALDADVPVVMRLEPTSPGSTTPFENVAFFSGFGSSVEWDATDRDSGFPVDVRIQPGLVAPGWWVLSAASDGKLSGEKDACAAKYQAGTSMAGPVVAGTAALVRQYFEDGFYPTGQRSNGSKLTPSGPLVKAVMIAGTAAMTGVSRLLGEPLAPPPSPFQGYGRMDLAGALPLAGDGNPQRVLRVVDGANFTTDGVAHNYTLIVAGGKAYSHVPLIACLVWNDYPGFPGALYVLVNDLNLRVHGPDGRTWWGNDRPYADFQNNVEKVVIPAPVLPGKYTIEVQASYLFIVARPQPYALAVQGGILGDLQAPEL